VHCKKRGGLLSPGLNNHAKVWYRLNYGDTPPALLAVFFGKLTHHFGGWLTHGYTASQYPTAAMSEVLHLSIVSIETGALGGPV